MSASPFVLSVLHPAEAGLGFLGALRRRGREVFATGGSFHQPTLLHASDGRRFRPLKPPDSTGLRDVLPLPGGGLLVCGEHGLLAASDDGGETWRRQYLRTQACLYALVRDAKGVVQVCGDDGGLWRSLDGGREWHKRTTGLGARILAIERVEDALILLDSAGNLHHLDREGCKRVIKLSSRPLTGLALLPTGTMIAVGDGGVVRRSTDGGLTWEAIAAPTTVDLEEAAWCEHGLFVVGDRGTVLRSDADGRTFSPVPTHPRRHLWSILEDGAGALIGGDEGLVLRLAHRDEVEPDPETPTGPRLREPPA